MVQAVAVGGGSRHRHAPVGTAGGPPIGPGPSRTQTITSMRTITERVFQYIILFPPPIRPTALTNPSFSLKFGTKIRKKSKRRMVKEKLGVSGLVFELWAKEVKKWPKIVIFYF